MNANIPQRKVVAGGFAGAITTLAVWTLEQLTGITVPAHIYGAINLILVFAVQYWVPNQAEIPDA